MVANSTVKKKLEIIYQQTNLLNFAKTECLQEILEACHHDVHS